VLAPTEGLGSAALVGGVVHTFTCILVVLLQLAQAHVGCGNSVHFDFFIIKIQPTYSFVSEMCPYAIQISLDLVLQLTHDTSGNLVAL
jgi:hypothetical protein